MACDIIMVTWNEPEMTARALESIKLNANHPYRLIVVDNASDMETVDFLEQAARSGEFGEMVLIRNAENRGWVKGANQGLLCSEAPYVCLVNNDILAGPGWLRNMIRTMEALPDVGLANPRGDIPKENERVVDVDTYARELAVSQAGRFTELDFCSGYCLMIRRAVIEKIGVFDEVYETGYYEDNDYSRRAVQTGYHCIRCHDAFVLHVGGKSFGKMPERKRQLVERNRAIFEQRWGKRHRYLVLAKYAMAEELLEAARRGDIVYVVENAYANPRLMAREHANIKFLSSWFRRVSSALYFLFSAYYLRYKKRIDSVYIKFEGQA